MKKLLLLLFLISISPTSNAQHPTLDYVNALETDVVVFEHSIALKAKSSKVDSQGNLIVLGQFKGTVDLDPSSAVFNVTKTGGPTIFATDLFIAKYNSSGNFIWGFAIGGTMANMQPGALSIDSTDSIIISGMLIGTADFDPGLGNEEWSAASDVFVAKYSSSGTYQWKNFIHRTPNSGTLRGPFHETKSNDYTIVGGEFDGIVEIELPSGIVFLQGQGTGLNSDFNVYFAEIDATGTWQTVQTVLDDDDRELSALDIDSNDNVILSLAEEQETVPNTYDQAVRRYGTILTGGEVLKLIPDPLGSKVDLKATAIDANNNVYVTGTYNGTIYKDGQIILASNTLTERNGFLIKIDGNDNVVWTKSFDPINGVAIIPDVLEVIDDEVYVSGLVNGSYNVSGSPSNPHVISHMGSKANSFIVKFIEDGSVIWSNVFESPDINGIKSLSLYDNKIYSFGEFRDRTDFNPDPNQTTTIDITNEERDFFICRFSDNPDSIKSSSINNLITGSDNPGLENLLIYPIQNRIYQIEYMSPVDHGSKSYQIFNTIGQQMKGGVLQQEGNMYQTTTDLSHLAAGVYLVELYSDFHKIAKRIVLK